MKKFTLIIIGFLLFACGKENFESKVNDVFAHAFKADEPGGSVLIMKGEKIVFSGSYGVADINTKEPITSKTLFNTGSISKLFVSYTIQILAREGKLSLNDSLSKYFTDFKNPEIANKVRIHHLLTHTSGLPDNRRVFLDSVALLTAKDEENFAPIKQNDSLLFEPGSQYRYSNPAFNGLALIIEKVSGKKWQEVVKEKILTPANMPTTVITDGPFPETGVSHCYLITSQGFMEKDYGEEPTFAAAGNGGVWSSTEELARFAAAVKTAAFLDRSQIVQSQHAYYYPNWMSDQRPFIGLSWFIEKMPDGLKMVYHTGTQGGFYGDLVTIPEKDITYIMLCNIPTPQEEKRALVLNLLKEFNWLD